MRGRRSVLAARAIWRISEDAAIPAPILYKALGAIKPEEPDVLTFQLVTQTLEEMGPAAASGSSVLVKFINEKRNKWCDRRRVLDVLKAIKPEEAERISLKVPYN